MMSKVVIAGGSGFVGTALADLLNKLDFEVVVLSRKGTAPPGARGVKWDGESLGPWATELDGAKAVVNLTGSHIAVKWTKEAKREILESRVRSTQVVGQAIRGCEHPPEVWINASGIGIYGDRGGEELTESSPIGKRGHFVVDTAFAWEEMHRQEQTPQTRKTTVRIGVVLGRNGGALEPLKKFTGMFLGGHHGPGSQILSWIHIDDLARILAWCIQNEAPQVVNATAPVPCTNRYFMATLRAVMGRPWSPPVPGLVLQLASGLFGAPDASLILEGQRVIPKAMMDAGFRFTHEEVREALVQLVK